jgi:hypothetical protein
VGVLRFSEFDEKEDVSGSIGGRHQGWAVGFEEVTMAVAGIGLQRG